MTRWKRIIPNDEHNDYRYMRIHFKSVELLETYLIKEIILIGRMFRKSFLNILFRLVFERNKHNSFQNFNDVHNWCEFSSEISTLQQKCGLCNVTASIITRECWAINKFR